MEKDLFYSKVRFTEFIAYRKNSVILLNLKEKELSYQVYELKINTPVISRIVEYDFMGRKEYWVNNAAAKIVKNSKTYFKPILLPYSCEENVVIYSYGKKLTDEEFDKIKELCRVSDFEQYRNRKMDMADKGYAGYRDEVRLEFSAISDSYIPYLELPMRYYYTEEYIWPSEKLYRFIITEILMKNKKVSKWVTHYGGYSLFW